MSKALLGLDIGSQTIKAVQLSHEKNKNSLIAAGYIATPSKVLAASTDRDEQELGNSINRLVHEMKISTTDVSISLPSSQVVTRVIEVPQMSEPELDSSIKWEAEQYIPWQLPKVKIDYTIIDKKSSTTQMKVLLVAAPIILIEKYIRIVTHAGLTPVSIETEILAVARSVSYSYANIPNILCVIIGAMGSEIALICNHQLLHSKPIPIGGQILTRAISEELGFEYVQAEEYKKTYGLEEDKLEGKIAKIILPFFSNIFNEMEKTIIYFKNQYPTEEISTIVISGGTSKLIGLVLEFTKQLGLDSQIANPFLNITVDPKILPVIIPDAPLYTIAVGLALKTI